MADQIARRAGSLQGILLLLPSTLSVMGVVVLAPGLPGLIEHFKTAPRIDVLGPLVLTTPALFIAIFSGPAGALADRYGRRALLLTALALYALVGTAPIWLNGLAPILISRALVGVAEAVILTVSTALIGDYFQGREREKWLAYQTGVAALASVVLFAIGGALSTLGWRAPFGVYAASLLLLIGVALFTWEPAPRDSNTPLGTDQPSFPWARMSWICAVTIAGSIIFFMTQIELSLALVQRGVVYPGLIGGLTAAAAIAVPVGTLIFRALASTSTAALLAVAFGLMGAGLVGMGLASSVPLMMTAVVANQLGCGIVLPTLITWALRGLPYHLRGKGAGIWTATFELGQFLTPLAFAGVQAALHGLFAAFTAFGAACLGVAGVSILAMQATRRRAAAAASINPINGDPAPIEPRG